MYKKPIKIHRIIIVEFLVKTVVNSGLNTLWLIILYGKGFMVILTARVIKNLIMWPIDSMTLLVLLVYAEKIISAQGMRRRSK